METKLAERERTVAAGPARSLHEVSAQTAGSKALCLHIPEIPPLGRARPHLHENHESAVCALFGEAGMWWG